jgi:putative FmdB family regulatory protein
VSGKREQSEDLAVPIYEYTCKSCNSKFEQLVRSMSGGNGESSRLKVKCPECGSAQTARALSVFAVSSESGKAPADTPACGRCGGAPGSCRL